MNRHNHHPGLVRNHVRRFQWRLRRTCLRERWNPCSLVKGRNQNPNLHQCRIWNYSPLSESTWSLTRSRWWLCRPPADACCVDVYTCGSRDSWLPRYFKIRFVTWQFHTPSALNWPSRVGCLSLEVIQTCVSNDIMCNTIRNRSDTTLKQNFA